MHVPKIVPKNGDKETVPCENRSSKSPTQPGTSIIRDDWSGWTQIGTKPCSSGTSACLLDAHQGIRHSGVAPGLLPGMVSDNPFRTDLRVVPRVPVIVRANDGHEASDCQPETAAHQPVAGARRVESHNEAQRRAGGKACLQLGHSRGATQRESTQACGTTAVAETLVTSGSENGGQATCSQPE